ncbi:PD-(D/E)XK nuclease family protein, partial [Candidatus Uhrbacteria bacterium]|nr:PD-(D/E)XK nuclease family protein [Candidatus Uhrbacteria bacterium]
DYKTGSPKTRSSLASHDKMQLLLYQLAAQEILGLSPQKLTYLYLEDQSRVSFLGDETELEALRATIREHVVNIRARQFEPTPGFVCGTCDYRTICPFRAVI